MKAALAIFAKTPGLTPAKTRLAASIGSLLAEEFYQHSVTAIKEIASCTQELSARSFSIPLSVHWAVAEKEGPEHSYWHGSNVMWTNEGTLGDRLHTIYTALIATHDLVIIIGTDSPLLTPTDLLQGIKQGIINANGCIIGPTYDGGFYLFACQQTIKASVWQQTQYSQATTFEQLRANLVQQGIPVNTLPPASDVDRLADLLYLRSYFANQKNLLPSQQHLFTWLNKKLLCYP